MAGDDFVRVAADNTGGVSCCCCGCCETERTGAAGGFLDGGLSGTEDAVGVRGGDEFESLVFERVLGEVSGGGLVTCLICRCGGRGGRLGGKAVACWFVFTSSASFGTSDSDETLVMGFRGGGALAAGPMVSFDADVTSLGDLFVDSGTVLGLI